MAVNIKLSLSVFTHLQVRIAFKLLVSSFWSRSLMCGGGGGGGGAAPGALWALIFCSDSSVLWELLSGNINSRHRAARHVMLVIYEYTYK